MEQKNKNILLISIISLSLVIIGATYAYFSARITGLESASTISLTAGRMNILYTEGDEEVIFNNIYPREEAWAVKTFTLTGWNTTDMAMQYIVGLNVITNTFPEDYLTYDLTLLASNNGNPIPDKVGVPIDGTGELNFGLGSFTNANGHYHRYELKIYFKDTGVDQNDAQGAVFSAKIFVIDKPRLDIVATHMVPTGNYSINVQACQEYMNELNQENPEIFTTEVCNSLCNGETVNIDGGVINLLDEENVEEFVNMGLVDAEYVESIEDFESGDTYEYGQFTYVFNPLNQVPGGGTAMRRNVIESDSNSPQFLTNSGYSPLLLSEEDPIGWAVQLTDKLSTSPVEAIIPDTINGYPIVNMNYMFSGVQASSIDLERINSANVTKMEGMFSNYSGNIINLDKLDTSNVENMSSMFSYAQFDTLDLKSFNMSSATNIKSMFSHSTINTLIFEKKDLSNVTDMNEFISYFTGNELRMRKTTFNNKTNSNVGELMLFFDHIRINRIDFSNSVFNGYKAMPSFTFYSLPSSGEYNIIFDGSSFPSLTSLDLINTNYFNNNSNIYLRNISVPSLQDFIISDHNLFDYIDFSGTNFESVSRFKISSFGDKTLVLNNTIFPALTSMSRAFQGIESGTIEIENMKLPNTTTMREMFYSAKSHPINYEDLDTSNVTDMSHLFDSAGSSTISDAYKLDMTNVTNIDGMFYYVTLDSLDFGKYKMPNITSLNSVFEHANIGIISFNGIVAPKLRSLSSLFRYATIGQANLNGLDTSNVTDMVQTFGSATFSSLDLRTLNTSKVTNMTSMFAASNITTLQLPNSFTTGDNCSFESMFSGFSINTLNLSGFDTSKVTNMFKMFSNANIGILNISSFDFYLVYSTQKMFNNLTTNSLVLPNNWHPTSVTYMFEGINIDTLDLKNIDITGTTNMEGMFMNCGAQTIIGLTNFDTSAVYNMAAMFHGANASELDLSSFDTNRVTNMGGMFDDYSNGIIYARTQTDANRFKDLANLYNGQRPNAGLTGSNVSVIVRT